MRNTSISIITINKIIYLIVLICTVSSNVYANPFIRLDSLSLIKSKKRILEGTASKETLIAYRQLLKDADKVLSSKNPSVIDKTILPPTGDKHDYLSISRYWWPDPEKEDGLPWVRYDGKTNPDTQTDAVDRKRIGFMGRAVRNLSLAYYFTDQEKYAKKAIDIINTWFIHPETRMNPHLDYAQSVPGNPNKRRSGILDGRSIVRFVPDAINLLSISENWTTAHQTNMTQWFSDYLRWLTTSDLGIKGSLQENNHGSWYKFQVASLAFYLGDSKLVKKTVELAQQSLEDMLDHAGGQPHELARSRSFFYSCFNLQALANIAVIGDKIGMNMWDYQSKSNKSLSLAIDYLTPVVHGEKWNHQVLTSIDVTALLPVITLATKHRKSKQYKSVILKIIKDNEQMKQNDTLFEFWLLHNTN